jgi:hypothetical protein
VAYLERIAGKHYCSDGGIADYCCGDYGDGFFVRGSDEFVL